jgi:hypothetical protein
MTIIMAMQIRSSISSLALISALQVSIWAVAGPAGAAAAADCLTEPGSSAAPNSHWYYRTDRTQQRKCWYLRGADGSPQEEALNTTGSVTAPAPNSIENFKAFLAQRGMTDLSDKDVQGLYSEFLAWKRLPGNEAKANQ